MRFCYTIPTAIVACIVLFTPSARAETSAGFLHQWNDVLYQGLREVNRFDFENRPLTSGDNPPRSSRAMAMLHGAIYDAVNGISPTHSPFRMQRDEMTPASKEAAVMEASYIVLTHLFGDDATEIVDEDRRIQSSISSIRSTQHVDLLDRVDAGTMTQAEIDAGIAWGQQVGQAMVDWRSGDGSQTMPDYDDHVDEYGKYRMDMWTPDAQSKAAMPGWGDVAPFLIDSSTQFNAPGPRDMNSAEFQEDLAEVINLGDRDRYNPDNYTGGVLPDEIDEQRRIAFFWAEKGLDADGGKNNRSTVTPPGHWNQIADEVVQSQGLNLEDASRLYAMLSLAGADATITAWRIKYEEDFWRPIHAHNWIPDDPDNPEAGGSYPEESDWIPLIPTSMHPEYTSGHSVASGNAAALLAMFFGTDNIEFTITGDDAIDGEFRTFASFSEAALEAGRSRIYGGIHYQFTNEDSLTLGDEIGTYVGSNFFQPLSVPEPTTLGLLALGSLAVLRRRPTRRLA